MGPTERRALRRERFTGLRRAVPTVAGVILFVAALALLGVYGSTGIAIALPSFSAIAFTVSRPMSVWPPFTFCGPRCSVPPV